VAVVKYLFLPYAPEEVRTPGGPEQIEQLVADYATANEAMAKAGVLLDCGGVRGAAGSM